MAAAELTASTKNGVNFWRGIEIAQLALVGWWAGLRLQYSIQPGSSRILKSMRQIGPTGLAWPLAWARW